MEIVEKTKRNKEISPTKSIIKLKSADKTKKAHSRFAPNKISSSKSVFKENIFSKDRFELKGQSFTPTALREPNQSPDIYSPLRAVSIFDYLPIKLDFNENNRNNDFTNFKYCRKCNKCISTGNPGNVCSSSNCTVCMDCIISHQIDQHSGACPICMKALSEEEKSSVDKYYKSTYCNIQTPDETVTGLNI